MFNGKTNCIPNLKKSLPGVILIKVVQVQYPNVANSKRYTAWQITFGEVLLNLFLMGYWQRLS